MSILSITLSLTDIHETVTEVHISFFDCVRLVYIFFTITNN